VTKRARVELTQVQHGIVKRYALALPLHLRQPFVNAVHDRLRGEVTNTAVGEVCNVCFIASKLREEANHAHTI
jgi:hypothetical protein